MNKFFKNFDTIIFVNVCELFRKQEMCNKNVEKDLMTLEFVPSHFKTKKMCEKGVILCKILSYAF